MLRVKAWPIILICNFIIFLYLVPVLEQVLEFELKRETKNDEVELITSSTFQSRSLMSVYSCHMKKKRGEELRNP